MLTELQAKQIEFLSQIKQTINGGHAEYFKERWGDEYEETIEALKSAYVKLLKCAQQLQR